MPAACTRHVHRGPQDYRPNGRCAHCQREAQKRYRTTCRDALRLLRGNNDLLAS